jgi:hypothetical protein
MYVPARKLGMSGYRRRGLGLSCPGDPACPGYVDPYLNAAQQLDGTTGSGNSVAAPMTAAQSLAQQQQALTLQAAQDPTTLTGWFNTYGMMAGLGVAVLGLVLAMSKR